MPALKSRVADQSEIPEKYRDLYVERDGEWVLDAEGVEDVSGLKSALERQKRERSEALAKLKQIQQQVGDLDPEQAREAMRKVQDLEERKLLDSGKVEELLKQRTDRMVREYEARLKSAMDAHAEQESRARALQQKLASTVIDNAIRSAALKAGIRPNAVDVAMLMGKQVWSLDEESGSPVARNGDQPLSGKGGKPMTIEEWAASLRSEHDYLFAPSTGTGATGARVGAGNAITLSREQALDPRQFAAAKAEAEKAGAELRIAG